MRLEQRKALCPMQLKAQKEDLMITVENVYRYFGYSRMDFTEEQQDAIESVVKAGTNEYALRIIVDLYATVNRMQGYSKIHLCPCARDPRLAELQDMISFSLYEYPDEAVELLQRGFDAELPLPLLAKIFRDPSFDWDWVKVILDLYIRAKEEEEAHDKPLMDVVDLVWDYSPSLSVIYSLVGKHYEYLHVWDYDTMDFVLKHMAFRDRLHDVHPSELIIELVQRRLLGAILIAALDSVDTDSFIRSYLRSEPMHRILLCQHPALLHVGLDLYRVPAQDEMSLEEICNAIDEAFNRCD